MQTFLSMHNAAILTSGLTCQLFLVYDLSAYPRGIRHGIIEISDTCKQKDFPKKLIGISPRCSGFPIKPSEGKPGRGFPLSPN